MYGDSLDALRGLLHSNFPKVTRIYVSTMPDSFIRPSFFINLATSDGEHLNRAMYQTDMTWQIVYFAPMDSKGQADVFNQLQVSSTLKRVLMETMSLTYTEPAKKATGLIEITGATDTIIPAGTAVKTSTGIQFETLANVTIGEDGVVEVAIQAMKYGVSSNVANGTITVMAEPIDGVTALINANPTTGGRYAEFVIFNINETEGGPRDAEVYITVSLQAEVSRPREQFYPMQDMHHVQKEG